MMEQLRPLGVKTLAQFSNYTTKKEKKIQGNFDHRNRNPHLYFQICRLDT